MRLRKLLLIALVGVGSLLSQESDGAMRVWWLDNIKTPLSKPSAAKDFHNVYEDVLLPPSGLSFKYFKGRIASLRPATNPTEIVLSVSDTAAADVKLVFKKPLKGSMATGSELSFRGVLTSMSQTPFLVTFNMNDEEFDGPELVGWTGH